METQLLKQWWLFSLSSQSVFQGYIHDTQFIFNLEYTHNTIRTELPQLPPLPINTYLSSDPFPLSFCFSRKGVTPGILSELQSS